MDILKTNFGLLILLKLEFQGICGKKHLSHHEIELDSLRFITEITLPYSTVNCVGQKNTPSYPCQKTVELDSFCLVSKPHIKSMLHHI